MSFFIVSVLKKENTPKDLLYNGKFIKKWHSNRFSQQSRKKSFIDCHAHFYAQEDLDRVVTELPYKLPKPHSLKDYLDQLEKHNIKPSSIMNAHLSILPDSENIFRSFKNLNQLQAMDSQRYGGIKIFGTIKADPQYATLSRLRHPQVKGIRFVIHDKTADEIKGKYNSAEYKTMYQRLRADQHIQINAMRPKAALEMIKQLPEHVIVAIDHLGMWYPFDKTQKKHHDELLDLAKERGNIYFKGPGYRTDIDPKFAIDFATKIIKNVGPDKLILSATDAPHIGTNNSNMSYDTYFTPHKAYQFSRKVALEVSHQTGIPVKAILEDNFYKLIQEPSYIKQTGIDKNISYISDYLQPRNTRALGAINSNNQAMSNESGATIGNATSFVHALVEERQQTRSFSVG
jgi:predicted TIM-barrel fold metal-dependent hydrolase